MKYFFLVISCFFYQHSFSQDYSLNQCSEDLIFLIESIKTYNPVLELYNPAFDERAKPVLNLEDKPYPVLELFQKVSQICALSNEGHFAVGYWQDTVFSGFIQNRYAYLPMNVKVIEDKIYVRETYTLTEEIPDYAEILSINGTSASDVLEKLYLHMTGDGEIRTYLQQQVSFGFPWMYYLYVDQPDSFTLEYLPEGKAKKKKVTIDAITRQVMVENVRARYKDDDNEDTGEKPHPVYEFEVKGSYALLKLKSFDRQYIEEYNLNERRFYNEIFTQIEEAGVEHLIIDLRNNTGGRNEFADELVPYIFKSEPADYLKRTTSWEGKKRTYKFPKVNKLAFKGRIYALVNGRTYSAGSTVARYLKEFGNAIIIGEETGTRYEGFAAGSKQRVVLPNSRIQIDIPRYHIEFPVSVKQRTSNRGLMPDIEVRETFETWKSGTDVVMEKTVQLIINN